MAESLLFNIVESLVKNIGSTALDEIASAWGFKTSLNKLKNTTNTIKDVMLDAEERQAESHAVRGWLNRLSTVVYAADDLFDEFATKASRKEVIVQHNLAREVLVFFSKSNQIVFAFNISKKIKKIRQELDDIVKDSSEFAFVLRPHEESRLSRPVRDQTHSYVKPENVIGRDDDRQTIIDVLLASCAAVQQRLSVICIVGIGGLGKTTLAQNIYNDDLVEKHFELKLWVCVSEDFDLKEVIKKILKSATVIKSQNLEMDQLQGQLRKQIEGKKYLLVLDDVWNEKPHDWLKLSEILEVGGEGSKILVTTRSRKVADIMGAVSAYELKGLSEKKSLELFEKMAFDGEDQKKPHLVKLGKQIVKKCAGVPLAIITLGTLLRGRDEHKWESIAGTGFAELADAQTNVMAILKLSYHHLFSPLKKCFAYCALFPKDFKFQMETLVELWMAEGFVIPVTETQSLKELGDEYLMLLLQRCFFQDVRKDEFGNISSFKMHDLIHDLAIEVAGAESKMAKFQGENHSDRIRHLSFDYYLTGSWKIPRCMLKAKQLRTFLLLAQFRDISNFNEVVLEQLISNFRCLRVLDLSNHGVSNLPKSIGELIHLRYLNLSNNPIRKLPNSVTKLQNLQTLILNWCRKLTSLPFQTRKLINLKSLDVEWCDITDMPPGLGELISLHKLPYFIVKSRLSPKYTDKPATACFRDLKNLNNLRGALTIKLAENLADPALEAKEANLSSKHGLTELQIQLGFASYNDDRRIDHDEAVLDYLKPHQNLRKLEIFWYAGKKLPSWSMTDSLCMTLPNLSEIRLFKCGSCRQLPSFSQLPFLRSLHLFCLESVEYMEISLPGIQPPPAELFFPSLQKLLLRNMDNLKGWWEETEATDCSQQDETLHQSGQRRLSLSFSGLVELEITDCPKLATFPPSPKVKSLVLKKVNKKLTVLKMVTSCDVSGDVASSVTLSKYDSKLKKLSVDEVEYLISLPDECLGQITSLDIEDSKLLTCSALEEVFKRLSSLRCLKFKYCDSLNSVSEGLEHLTVLDRLHIWSCKELDLSLNEQPEDGMPWKAIKSLRLLDLSCLPKLVHLPSGLQHLTKLSRLCLCDMDNLVALPEWISCFSSLKDITLYSCPKLTYLPEELCRLTSLKSLQISRCPGLTKRCRGPNGSDWPKIQHIPLFSVTDD